jgi:hypothetical protein
MSRPTLEVADIIRVSGSRFSERHASRLAYQHRKVPSCRMLGTSVKLAASSWPIMPARRASPTSLRAVESRTLIVEGESDSMAARHSIIKDRERGRLAQKAKRSSRALA